MKTTLILLSLTAALAGCAVTSKSQSQTSYDFGPLTPAGVAESSGSSGSNGATTAAAAFPAIVVADVTGPASLDTQRMYYRLLYSDAQQSRPYAFNNWSVTPLQLLSQRMKARFAQAGVKVLNTTDAAGGLPLLRLEADDFSQNFDSATSASASVSLRASVFRNHKLVDQRTFSRRAPAGSADAPGGARALAAASDAIAADILAWMATLPQQ